MIALFRHYAHKGEPMPGILKCYRIHSLRLIFGPGITEESGG
jgi:hypothetical protein